MELKSALLAGCAIGVMIGWVFFLIFGRTTVRRLSKNPETKHRLGAEFVSGWRIFNVAEALVVPTSFFQKMQQGPLSGLWADAALLRQHASRADFVLAHLLFWSFVPSAALLVVTVLLDLVGAFG